MPRTVAALIMSVLAISTAQAQDYRAEIEQHVIVPCLKYATGSVDDYPSMNENELLAAMRIIIGVEHFEKIHAQVSTIVAGRSREERRLVYRYFAQQCIKGASMGR